VGSIESIGTNCGDNGDMVEGRKSTGVGFIDELKPSFSENEVI
jgi:hypothetical protein